MWIIRTFYSGILENLAGCGSAESLENINNNYSNINSNAYLYNFSLSSSPKMNWILLSGIQRINLIYLYLYITIFTNEKEIP